MDTFLMNMLTASVTAERRRPAPAERGPAAASPAPAEAILVVDDDPYTQQLFKSLLRRRTARLEIAGTLAQARELFRTADFNLIVLDQRLPDGNGLDFFAQVRAERPRQMALLITGYADVQDAVRSVREGLFDYLTKPFENLDELEAIIGKALEMDRAYREINDLKALFGATQDQPVIGHSPRVRELLAQVRHAAPLDTTVLIDGESGTGKEVYAKLVHSLSTRRRGALVAVNCGALSESLLEAALFGYDRGAFTGAVKNTPGYFERADGGTLFLDEITDMSPKLQASLLRVLQERSFERLGSGRPQPGNFRLVCATNKSLDAEVKSGRFRADLYFRLNVVHLRIPPLREHAEDVVPLALYFLSHFSAKFGKPAATFTPDAIAAMERAAWPGNIRELQHAVERAVALSQGGLLGPADLGLAAAAPPVGDDADADPGALPFREARDAFDRRYFAAVLRRAGGSIAEAARISGIARQNLYVHLHRLGLAHGRGAAEE